MKMKDELQLPFKVEEYFVDPDGVPHYRIVDAKRQVQLEYSCLCLEDAECICHAVNSHDSLQAENEVLKHNLANSKVYPLNDFDKTEKCTVDILYDKNKDLQERLDVAVKGLRENYRNCNCNDCSYCHKITKALSQIERKD